MDLHRRTFIRTTGVSLALPWLNVFADDTTKGASVVSSDKQRRVG